MFSFEFLSYEYTVYSAGTREKIEKIELEEHCSAIHLISDSEVGVEHRCVDLPPVVSVNLFMDLGNLHVHGSMLLTFAPSCVLAC